MGTKLEGWMNRAMSLRIAAGFINYYYGYDYACAPLTRYLRRSTPPYNCATPSERLMFKSQMEWKRHPTNFFQTIELSIKGQSRSSWTCFKGHAHNLPCGLLWRMSSDKIQYTQYCKQYMRLHSSKFFFVFFFVYNNSVIIDKDTCT